MPKVGIRVTCAACHRQKKPRGRSAPMGLIMCVPPDPGLVHYGCLGYDDAPFVGDLWPGETEEDFGYPCSDAGTKEMEAPMPTNPEVEMLRKALKHCQDTFGDQALEPRRREARNDSEQQVLDIAEIEGYGNLMSLLSSQWNAEVPGGGAFAVGTCIALARRCMAHVETALAAPAPKQKLRPMSEAPRDGRKLLAYALDRSPVIVWANRGEETVWTHSDGTIAPKWLLGWLDLPEVEL